MMPINKVLHIGLLVLLAGSSNGQQKAISCIKLTSYHIYMENDLVERKYLRTLWFDMCDEVSSLSKQWTFDQAGETVGHQLTYMNSLTHGSIELNWDQNDSSYSLHVTTMDTLSDLHHSFQAYVKNDTLHTVNYETWRIIEDSVMSNFHSTIDAWKVIDELKSWIQLNRNSYDSLSVPAFPDLSSVKGGSIKVSTGIIDARHVTVFEPFPQSYGYGSKRIPEHIISSTKRVVIGDNRLHKRRKHQSKDVELIYDIYFRAVANKT